MARIESMVMYPGAVMNVLGKPVTLRSVPLGLMVFFIPGEVTTEVRIIPSYSPFEGEYIDTVVDPSGMPYHLIATATV